MTKRLSQSNKSHRADSVRMSEKNFSKTLDSTKYKTRPGTSGETADDMWANKPHRQRSE